MAIICFRIALHIFVTVHYIFCNIPGLTFSVKINPSAVSPFLYKITAIPLYNTDEHRTSIILHLLLIFTMFIEYCQVLNSHDTYYKYDLFLNQKIRGKIPLIL